MSMASSTVEKLTVEQMAESIRRLLEGKSLTQSETKQMLKSLEDSCINHKYVDLFLRLSDSELSKLIDFSVKIAIEIIDLSVSADQAIALRIMRIVQGMDVTVQCMEVVTRLYQYRPELPREPLNDYVRYCVRHCLAATPSSSLNRVVRLVAITLKNLLKSGSISASELSLELREFGVRFCQHPDTTFLFNTVGLAQLKERPYVCTLNNEDKSFLYAQPGCALFIFRMLPNIAQQLATKMIWNAKIDDVMTASSFKVQLDSAKSLLTGLGLLLSNGILNPVFRQSYLHAIMLGTQKCAKINSVEVDIKRRQNEEELGKKAAERWECILKYLALPSEKNMSSVSSTTCELFSAAGFTNNHDGTGNLEITSAGFQFLLLNPVQQVWTYMIEYLKLEAAKGCDIKAILELLIRVVICVVRGSNFSHRAFEISTNWTNEQTNLLMHMRELGLIFIRKRKDG